MDRTNRRTAEGQATPALLLSILGVVDLVALAAALKAFLDCFA